MSDSPVVDMRRPVRSRLRVPPAVHDWLRAHALDASVAAALVLLTLGAAIAIVPGIHSTGAFDEQGRLELGTAAPPDRVRAQGAVEESATGYVADPFGSARVTIPLTLPERPDGRVLVRLWVYGSDQVPTTVSLVTADGRRLLARAGTWAGETFDVTAQAGAADARLEVSTRNRTGQPALFVDRVVPTYVPDTAVATAAPWAVALLVALFAAALLAVTGRLRRHWPLPPALAAGAALVWSQIPEASFDLLSLPAATTFSAALSGSWFGFHDGLLWGSWIGPSSLAVQLQHAFIPLLGDAPVSVRSGSLLALLLALAALYALGNRIAGRVGAVAAVVVALAATPLRDAAVDGGALPVLVLAAALFAYALHACLAEASPSAAALLGAAIALLALAEPLWLPGALLALPVVVFTCAPPGMRVRALAVGAAVAGALLVGHLASTAAQNEGSMFADLSARAIAARNSEFAGQGHGAPSVLEAARDPLGGRPVTLAGYVFGDHSVSQIAGGTLTGGQEALSAFGGGATLAAAVFALALLGVLYTLLLPRLRLLVLVPLLVALPALFVAGRTLADPLLAGAAVWPALPACAAILAFAAVELVRRRREKPE